MARVMIITEGRSAWNIVENKNKKKTRITLDSPPLNLIHSSMIARKELKKGKEVILLPIVDKLIGTKEYTYSRTFPKNMGFISENPSKEEVKEFYNKKVVNVFRKWKEHLNIHVLPSKKAYEIIKEKRGIKRVDKIDFLSESEEVFRGFKKRRIKHFGEHYLKMVEETEMLKPIPMSAFDIETGRFLINLTLNLLKTKNRKNLDISYEVFPSMYVNTKEKILHIFEPIFRYYNTKEALARVNGLFLNLLNNKNAIPLYNIPLFYDVNGFYNSATRSYLKNSNIFVEPRSRMLGRLGDKYKINKEAFMEAIYYKELISIKYPLIILDYIIRIFEKLTMRASLENAEEIHNLIKKAIKKEIELKNYINDLVKRTNVKEKLEKIYFIEGDLGGVNIGTGGLVDKVFKMIADAIEAEYIRVISIEREILEEKVKKPGFLSLIENIIKLDETGGSIYIDKGGKIEKTKINDLE